jgi:hypothetical protein
VNKEELKNSAIDDLIAVKSAISSSRLRALVARERTIITEGNVYNEKIPEEKLDSILDEAISNEFVRHKILVKIKNKGKSVPEISKEISIAPNKVLEHIVTLRARGLVDLEKITDEVPTFISIKEDT